MRYHNYLNSKMKPAILLIILVSLAVTLLLAACGDTTATTGPAAPVTNTAAPTTNPVTTAAPVTTVPPTTVPATTAATTAVSTAPATTASPTKPATTIGATPGAAGPVTLGEPFYLKMGQSTTVKGTNLTLKFALISEDSRCPDANPKTGKSVACFWAGQVTANIEVSENGQASQTVKLTLPGSVNTNTTSKVKVGNYQIEVKQILPRAIIDIEINPEDYVVTLVVS